MTPNTLWRWVGYLLLLGQLPLAPRTLQVIVGGALTGANVAVTITVPTSTPTYDNGTSLTLTSLAGTAKSDNPIVSCTYVNSLGGSGTATGPEAWSLSSLALTVGSNILTVTCRSTSGDTGTDILTVAVAAAGGSVNPLAATRQPAGNTAAPNTVWAAAGVEGGIPTLAGRCTTGSGTSQIAPYTGSAAAINNAITSCDANHYVELGGGATPFTLSGCIVLGTNGVSLRGQGANSTKIFVNGDCGLPGTFLNAAIRMSTSTANIACLSNCSGGSGPNNSTTWTVGPYTQGTTSIVLNGHANMTVGHTIWLDQLNDTSDGYPAAGDLYICDGDEPCSWEGGNAWARGGRAQVEGHKVVGCRDGSGETAGASCTSNTIVISPGVIMPNFRSGQSPGAWWGSSAALLHDVGVENLSLDYTGVGTGAFGIGMENCTTCWVRGTRTIYTSNGNQTFNIGGINLFHVTVANNYLFGTVCLPPSYPNMCNIQYTYSPNVATMVLFENNILHHSVTPIASNDPETASVYAYNYLENSYYSPGPQDHNSGDLMNLFEGNNIGSIFIDTIHGTHFFLTFFRNHFDGTAHNTNGVSSYGGLVFWPNSRFHNAVANVFGSNAFDDYETDHTADSSSSIYGLGWKGSHGCSAGCLSDDPRVKITMLRACNWDNVTSSSDTASNDQTGTRNVAGEAPSGIVNYSNQALADCLHLPASLYLSAKPAFFQALTWPSNGPDVASGTAPNNATAPTGGHANKIPARVCFESLSNDTAGYPSSYGPVNNQNVKTFNAATCYGS